MKNLYKKIHLKILKILTTLRVKIYNFIDRLYFSINRKDIKKPTKLINYFLVVWGDDFFDILDKIFIPSLLQKDNIPLLKKEGFDQTLNIFVKKDSKDNETVRILESIKRLKKIISVNIISESGSDNKYFLKKCLLKSIRKSIQENSISSIMTPDHLYANGSIYNLIKIIGFSNIGVASSASRVLWNETQEIFKSKFQSDNFTISNRDLVRHSFDYLHPCFKDSFIDSNPAVEGMTIKKINNDGLYEINCSRINVCAVRFTESDYKFFQLIDDYNHIDKLWPRKLILENRYKIIGDSDVFFYAELTKNDQIYGTFSRDYLDNNSFANNSNSRTSNHIINENFSSFWKL